MGEGVRTSIIAAIVSVVMLTVPLSGGAGAPSYSEWSVPRNLGPVVNSGLADTGPAITMDGLRLYFGSGRAGGLGSFDIYVSRRASVTSPWGPPINLGPTVNSPRIDNVPCLSRDEHWMFFNSNRPGGFGDRDVWASYRAKVKDDFGWQTPVNLGPGVNTKYWDGGGCSYESGDGPLLLYFNSFRPGGPGPLEDSDIFVATQQPDETFGDARLVPELSSPANDRIPRMRFDGLEIFFFSDQPGGFGEADIWVSTRRSTSEPWGTPVNLGPTVNGRFTESQAYIAPDRVSLYFVSTRPGGSGGPWDLYVTTRVRTPVGK